MEEEVSTDSLPGLFTGEGGCLPFTVHRPAGGTHAHDCSKSLVKGHSLQRSLPTSSGVVPLVTYT